LPPELVQTLRQVVALRAQFRCEYCLYPENRSGFAHQVDHIVSRKHGGLSKLDNLAYSCIFCNRYKGSDVTALHAGTGNPVRLFHPRVHRWQDHFRVHGAVIEPLTEEGEVTTLVLRFNQAERVIERAALQNTGEYPRGD